MAKTLFIVILGAFLVATISPAQEQVKESLKKNAVEQLEKTIAAREPWRSGSILATNLGQGRPMTFGEIEKLFVDGKISARQFQGFVEALRASEPPPSAPQPAAPSTVPSDSTNNAPAGTAVTALKATEAPSSTATVPSTIEAVVAPEVEAGALQTQDKVSEVLRASDADPAKNPPPGPALKPEHLLALPGAEKGRSNVVEQGIEEDFENIFSKMDRLMELKKQREKAKEEALHPGALDAQGRVKSKRERLNDLMRLHVYGELSKEEYEARRAAIIAEPEPKREE